MPNANDSAIIANTFQDGMNTDLSELASKKTQLSYSKNCKFITNAGNQLILQKEDGTESVAELDEGYLPLAVKELGNIAYIISHNESTGKSQLGSFPSPDYDSIVLKEMYQAGWGTLTTSATSSMDGTQIFERFSLGYYNTPAASDTTKLADYKSILHLKSVTVPTSIYVSIGAEITDTLIVGQDYYYTITGISKSEINVLAEYDGVLGHTPTYTTAEHSVYEIAEDDANLNLVDIYKPLRNFYADSDIMPTLGADYTDWFDTTLLGFTSTSIVDIELQLAYDNSVNIIFTDDSNPVRLVNTSFAVSESGLFATVIDRDGINDTNVYSVLGFKDTELIPENETVPYLSLDEVSVSGVLLGGSYRYYFKLVDRDGVETNIVQESMDVHIHHGNSPDTAYGAKPGEATDKSIKWTLSNIASRHAYVNVYFSIAAGETSAALSVYKIDDKFSVDSDGSCTILHTGYQPVIETTASDVFIQYSTIAAGKSIASVNNRLAIANTSSEYALDDSFQAVANALFPHQTVVDVYDGTNSTVTSKDQCYANSYWSYNNSSFHKQETYEFGIVFETLNGLSPVYPTKGSYTGEHYNDAGYRDEFEATTSGLNSKGVYKVPGAGSFGSDYTYSASYQLDMRAINTAAIEALLESGKATGFFFVRKQRIEDKLAVGFITPVTAVGISSVSNASSETYTGQRLLGYRDDSLYAGSRKFIPCPGMIIPQTCEYVTADTDKWPSEDSSKYIDFTLHACNTKSDGRFALYVPDLDCSTATQASKFDDKSVGLSISTGQTGPFSPEYQNTKLYQYRNEETFRFHNGNNDSCFAPYFSRACLSTYVTSSTFGTDSCKLSHIKVKQNGYSDGSFASDCIRNLWYLWDDPLMAKEFAKTQLFVGTKENVMKGIFNKDTGYSTRDTSVADDPTGLWERTGSAVYYGQYLGVSGLESVSEDWNNRFRFYAYPNEDENDYSSSAWNATVFSSADDGFDSTSRLGILGFMTDIYPEGRQEPISLSVWISRYGTTSGSYKAITHRMPISELSNDIHLSGGDCYVGRMCKQVWHPAGNTLAITATDVVKYALESAPSNGTDKTRYALGMTQTGFAMEYPAISKFNFYLRTKEEETDTALNTLYGEDKSFLPLRGIDNIRGWKQFETTTFNAGYEGQYSITSYYQLDDNPFTTTEFTNRIYVSDVSTSQEFSNSFRSFKGLNFRDYNKELGPIVKITNFRDSLIAVFDAGIVSIGVDERSMVSQDTGGVYTDSSSALAQKSNLISAKYGSKHVKSILTTPKFVYGIDYSALKIWKTDGKSIQIFSDMSIQSLLAEFKTALGASVDVFSSYDENSHNIFFTFNNRKGVERTIMYSELLEVWVAETDSHRSFTVSVKNESYMLNRYQGNKINKEVEHFSNYISDYSGGRVQQVSEIEFIIYNNGTSEIMLNNIVAISNNNIPDKIEYSSEHMSASQSIKPYTNVNFDLGWTLTCDNGSYDFDIDLNGNDFEFAEGDILTTQLYGNVVVSKVYGYNAIGTVANLRAKEVFNSGSLVDTPIKNGAQRRLRLGNAVFENGNVRIVSQPDMKNTKQSLAQRLAKKSSKIRGKWIKVRITYTGCNKLYLNSVLSYITGSYS